MDAGTGALTSKVRLRQHLLDGEQDIDTLSESLQQHQYQQQQQNPKYNRFQPAYIQQQHQQFMNVPGAVSHTNSITSASTTNYDIMTPLPATGSPFTSNSNPSYTNINTNSSRKSSMTSQTAAGVNRFFRRNKGADLNFNEDSGADIMDLTNGSSVSFEDITHMRNRGPYAMSSHKALDTAPIIPTLGGGGALGGIGPASGSKVNNVQYRKQMNQQKKLAMINGARANSLATGNPMMMQQSQYMGGGPNDPRTMSMVNSNPRTMSLNSQGPRTMSMRSGPFPQRVPYNPQLQQQQQQQAYGPGGAGPRAQSLRTGPYPPQQVPMGNGVPPNGPRTMSLMNGGMPNNGPRSMSLMNGGMPQSYPRTKSLGTSGPPLGYQGPPLRSQNLVPANPPQQQYQPPPQQQQQMDRAYGAPPQEQQYSQPIQQAYGPGQQPFIPRNAPQLQQQQYNQWQNLPPQPQKLSQNSSDSLQEAIVEEEEEEPQQLQPNNYNADPISKDKSETRNEENIIYNFENEDPNAALSRKSTLKKNNSMRVRKLNLFNDEKPQTGKKTLSRKKPPVSPADANFAPVSSNDSVQNSVKDLPRIPDTSNEALPQKSPIPDYEEQEEEEEDLNELPGSPTFNVVAPPTRESYLDDEDTNPSNDGYKALGANARASTHDVFVTALDFNSPQKSNKSMKIGSPHPSPQKSRISGNSDFPSPNVEKDQSDEQSTLQEDSAGADTSAEDTTPKTSPPLNNPSINRNISDSNSKFRNIVANTVFSKFRSPSAEATPKFSSPVIPNRFADGDEQQRSESSSVYESNTPRKMSKYDLNNSDTDDSEVRRRDQNGVFEQSTNGETTPPTSSTSNISHKVGEKYMYMGEEHEGNNASSLDQFGSSLEPSQQEEKQKGGVNTHSSRRNSYDSSFYQNFSEPIHDIPEEQRRSQDKTPDFTQFNTDKHENIELERDSVPKSISARRSSSGESIKMLLSSHGSVTKLSSATPASGQTVNKRSSFSLNGTKNIFKRFSKSSKRTSSIDEGDSTMNPISSRNSSMTQTSKQPLFSRRVSSSGNMSLSDPSVAKAAASQKQPLTFTKEEMSIMNCNNDLLNELELVTTELASSIKRELALESKLRSSPQQQQNSPKLDEELKSELTEKSRVIADLQEKLSKERRLRFISEEHALLGEHGQAPSALKLNYEKTELYKQLLIKNDLVHQLEDKLSEYEKRNSGLLQHERPSHDIDLLEKYNELLKENTNLKVHVVPDLERKLAEKSQVDDYDESQLEIQTLKMQRDELREVINKLTSSNNAELKLAQEKIKHLQSKLDDMKQINDRLTNRNVNDGKKGGKLNGFSIVSPTKKLFDD
ncbi:conserved hypothetical protein [Candida dubliniensis CD36]|uniref:Uncharacterized protein n=1 Tax=Candida dubliniensis (strain CD36 / ATCC MYA-646 / CBS 7987 / NCPF 3949 / NRRL Y-17841) TaxID=573826 RepID=B9WBL3_CANDC|nr:conserved hypothetical protein [Candida dubliniensis CD36]CAX43784.1 conserved hypothetical protein [Candida dubliniensis CD36]